MVLRDGALAPLRCQVVMRSQATAWFHGRGMVGLVST